MKAAGRTLTVGELRDAIAGLDDNVPVTALGDDRPVLEAEAMADGLELHVADQDGIAEVVEWVVELVDDAGYRMTSDGAKAIVADAAALLQRTGIASE